MAQQLLAAGGDLSRWREASRRHGSEAGATL